MSDEFPDWGDDESAPGDSRSPTPRRRSRSPRQLALQWYPVNHHTRRTRSAVGDENTRRFTADISYLGTLSWFAVFAQGSRLWEFLESVDMKANWNDNRQGVARGEVASDLGDKRVLLFRFWHGTYDDDQLRKHYNLTMSDMKNFMNCISIVFN